MNSTAFAIVILIAYFAPTWIARRGQRGSVFVINLFVGWTLLGWVIALYMAIRTNETAKGDV